jgi:ABC-2 type transport system ATP-binding protein
VLETVRLTKSFGPCLAVGAVSISVKPGEFVGLVGPNGGGKSTLLRLVAGCLAPSSGTAIVCGHDLARRPLAAKRALGYLPQRVPSCPNTTAAGFLAFAARLRGYRRAEAERRVGHVSALLRLAEVLDRPIATLPKEGRRRVALAQALLHDPPVVLLDALYDGLDANQKHEIRAVVQTLTADKAIILATDLLDEVERACSRVIVLAGGRVVADAATAELTSRSRYRNAVRLVLSSDADTAAVAALLSSLPDVRAVEPANDTEGGGCWVFPRHGRPIVAEVAEVARLQGWPVAGLRAERGRLDDVFRAITLPGRLD